MPMALQTLFIYLFVLVNSYNLPVYVSVTGNLEKCGKEKSPCPTISDALISVIDASDSVENAEEFHYIISIFENHDSFLFPTSTLSSFTHTGKPIKEYGFYGIKDLNHSAYISLILLSPILFTNTLLFDRINFILFNPSSFNFSDESIFRTDTMIKFSSVSFVGEDPSHNNQKTIIDKILIGVLHNGALVMENSIVTGILFSSTSTAVYVAAGGSAMIIGTTFHKIVRASGHGGAIDAQITAGSSLLLQGAHFLDVSVLPPLNPSAAFPELGKGGAVYVLLSRGGAFVVSGVNDNPSVFDGCSADLGGGVYVKLQDDLPYPDSDTNFLFEANTTLKFLRATGKYGKHIFVESSHNLELFVSNYTLDFESYNAAFLTDTYALMGVSGGRTDDYIPLYRYILQNPCVTIAGGVCPHGCYHGTDTAGCVSQCDEGEQAVSDQCEVFPNTLIKRIFNRANLWWIVATSVLILLVLVLSVVAICLCCRKGRGRVQHSTRDKDSDAEGRELIENLL